MINSSDVHAGFIFSIDGKMQRVGRFDETTVNGIIISKCKPVVIEDYIMDEVLGLKYYNGWFFGDTTIYRANGQWLLSINGIEVDTVILKYIHQVQAVIYSLYHVII